MERKKKTKKKQTDSYKSEIAGSRPCMRPLSGYPNCACLRRGLTVTVLIREKGSRRRGAGTVLSVEISANRYMRQRAHGSSSSRESGKGSWQVSQAVGKTGNEVMQDCPQDILSHGSCKKKKRQRGWRAKERKGDVDRATSGKVRYAKRE